MFLDRLTSCWDMKARIKKGPLKDTFLSSNFFMADCDLCFDCGLGEDVDYSEAIAKDW
jgi:hypothetical protein